MRLRRRREPLQRKSRHSNSNMSQLQQHLRPQRWGQIATRTLRIAVRRCPVYRQRSTEPRKLTALCCAAADDDSYRDWLALSSPRVQEKEAELEDLWGDFDDAANDEKAAAMNQTKQTSKKAAAAFDGGDFSGGEDEEEAFDLSDDGGGDLWGAGGEAFGAVEGALAGLDSQRGGGGGRLAPLQGGGRKE